MNIELPLTSGKPVLQASLKSEPSDFIVREQLEFEFDNLGEHLYLHVRKCGLNTNDVVQHLQKQFSCHSVDIGVSGLKDKKAVTDQWFSVRTPKTLLDAGVELSGFSGAPREGEFKVLESHRHSKKLRRGAHRQNHFIITLRQVEPLESDQTATLQKSLAQRLAHLQKHGFANYFGPQRFGHNAQNLVKAERLFKQPKWKVSRSQRSLYVSAARSQLFNAVCAERVNRGDWNQPLHGEPMLLDGSNSFFIYDGADNAVVTRCAQHDIHPTGPLWGRGTPIANDACALLENAVLKPFNSFTDGLEKVGLEQHRRALRSQVTDVQCEWISNQVVKLDFKLLKGVYATSFLSEFMINC